MNGDNKEIVTALHELAKEVAVLKEKHEGMEAYIFKELKVDIEKLCARVEKCMDKSVDERHRDLKWMIALLTSAVLGMLGWVCFFLKMM